MSENTNGTASKTLNPFARTLTLILNVHLLGISRKVETRAEGVEIDVVDDELVTVNKKLLKCDEYDAIKTRVGKLKSALKKMSLPGAHKLFKGGTFAILKPRVLDAIKELEAAQQELTPLFNNFCNVYEKRRDENIVALGALGNLADYPTVQVVRKAFGVDYEWVQIGVSPELQDVDPTVFESEVRKQQDKIRSAGEDAMLVIGEMLSEAINSFYDALKPQADGKRKIVATPLKQLKELLDNFACIYEGTQLEALSTKLKGILGSTNAETLRESPATRKLLEKRMIEAKKDIEKTIGPATARRFRIED